jgi:tetratricopeptide (TPR) repeat protein
MPPSIRLPRFLECALCARFLPLADRLPIALLVTVGFLLGCHEMADSDIWWHLSGGRWIIAHGRVPHLDPFTFGSQDRVWVDIHWFFEVLMAMGYRLGGVPALILVAAGTGATALLVALCARRRDWPIGLFLIGWLPALILMSFRLDPRPEIFSLLFIAVFLAVLWRAERRPALCWLLPPVQLLWVNMQGLFIFGPILFGCFLSEHAAFWLSQGRQMARSMPADQRRWWRHVAGAFLAVSLACLANPYFLDGARFPFDLYPKATGEGNIYKRYIDELASPRALVERIGPADEGGWWHVRVYYLMMLLLPLSFLVPAVWRAAQTARRPSENDARGPPINPPPTAVWIGGPSAMVGLLLASAVTLPSPTIPPWAVTAGAYLPWVVMLLGFCGAALVNWQSPVPATVLLASATSLCLWMAWLRQHLLGQRLAGTALTDAAEPLGVLAAVGGAAAVVVVLYWGGSIFRLLVAVAFAYLSLQAVQNMGRFGLVAGMIVAWNFGDWTVAFGSCSRAAAHGTSRAWVFRTVFVGLFLLWVIALATDRYYAWTGERRHCALRELPLEFPHEAIRFAGRPGLPERALVYDLGNTGLYDFYNGPRCKPFMDGRLEMPSHETFKTYVEIEKLLATQDARALLKLRQLGNPLVLLNNMHGPHGAALLLTHPDWRCIYFDELAATFVHRESGVSTGQYPTVDFGKRHFAHTPGSEVPQAPGTAFRELFALHNLATALQGNADATWTWRIPVLLAALDAAARALQEEPARWPAAWTLLGGCYSNLVADLRVPPPAVKESWDPATGLPLALATYCYRRALELAPNDASALRFLHRALEMRQIADVRLDVGARLLALDRQAPGLATEAQSLARELQSLSRALHSAEQGDASLPADLAAAFDLLVKQGRVGAALSRIEGANSASWPWSFADRVAAAYMHLGQPAQARRVWQQAQPPSESLRLCRIASTFWVERDFETANRLYREAEDADPRSADALWGQAMLNAQLGNAEAAYEACRTGLDLALTPQQRSDLQGLKRWVANYRE